MAGNVAAHSTDALAKGQPKGGKIALTFFRYKLNELNCISFLLDVAWTQKRLLDHRERLRKSIARGAWLEKSEALASMLIRLL